MRVGSLFTGYGGLDMAVGGDVVWYSEIEPAACKILAEHYPGVPNLGDITVVDWSTVEPVDVITGGYPCQPFSTAGMRRGKNDERHLWPYVRDAISTLRPAFAVLENVRGHLSMGLADVIGDLAGVGYDARWGLVRASDAGAPHGRARVFIVAYPHLSGFQGTDSVQDGTIRGKGLQDIESGIGGAIVANSDDSRLSGTLPITVESEHNSSKYLSDAVADSERFGCGETCGATTEQTSRTSSTTCGCIGIPTAVDWGQYGSAIKRWEFITRIAPEPTIHRGKRERLNPRFVEWMMGLPDGHVTGRGLTPSQELKMLGNGVCPQQAALALRLLGVA
jgi:DNA (cytosine-5)-methyltransferase 1